MHLLVNPTQIVPKRKDQKKIKKNYSTCVTQDQQKDFETATKAVNRIWFIVSSMHAQVDPIQLVPRKQKQNNTKKQRDYEESCRSGRDPTPAVASQPGVSPGEKKSLLLFKSLSICLLQPATFY